MFSFHSSLEEVLYELFTIGLGAFEVMFDTVIL